MNWILVCVIGMAISLVGFCWACLDLSVLSLFGGGGLFVAGMFCVISQAEPEERGNI